MDLKIVRVASSEKGTFGVLSHNEIPILVTAERPWLDNAARVSCIPEGVYPMTRIMSPKFGDTFEINSVPGRSEILLHKGNYPMTESHGCILLGLTFYVAVDGSPYIVSSAIAFKRFLDIVGKEKKGTLTIC